MDRVVPVAVELGAADVEHSRLGIGDLDASGILVPVELRLHRESGIGRRGGDELDHRLQTGQRTPTPVHADEAEEAVFYLVPLARAGREVGDGGPRAGAIKNRS